MPEVRRKFAALSTHGTKLYKFQQRKSFGEITQANFPTDFEHVSAGICMGVVLAWVKERLSSSNNWRHRALVATHFRNRPGYDFMPNRRPATEIHTRNAATMRAAAQNQIVYSQEGLTEALRLFSLNERHSVESKGAMRATPEPGSNLPHIADVAGAMTDAVAPERLSAGTAVIFQVSIYDLDNGNYLAGHAVAAYRSHGNHLFFFDPNIGAYQVVRPAEFMQAWVAGCRTGRNWRVEFDVRDRTKRNGWTYLQSGSSLPEAAEA